MFNRICYIIIGMNVYFDNAASTKVRDEAVDAMVSVMTEKFGNPSSIHTCGRLARDELNTARESLAYALGTKANNIYFTSGGTEANNWAIFSSTDAFIRRSKGSLSAKDSPPGKGSLPGKHIITSAIEHSAVMDPIKKLESKGFEVTYLMPDTAGRIPARDFAAALRDDTVFASIMLVNNEMGSVNPVGEYSSEIKKRGLDTVLHTDAIQGLCKIPFTVRSLGADLVTVSSHKLHGPKGVGALYVKDGIKLTPLILGGNHENEKRGGTEALPAAVGFGVAARLGISELEDTSSTVRRLREYISERLKTEIPEVVFIGEGDSPFILCISLPGHKSTGLMTALDEKGICVSRSAACKKGARSRTLEAMKLKNDVIDGSLRVSFSRYSTKDEADHFVTALKEVSKTMLKSL